MSNVSRVLSTNENNDKCLVVYNKYSIDSFFGAGIIKYICENITDVTDDAVCFAIDDLDEGFDISEYKNVSFIGCYPSKSEILRLYEVFGDKLLFVLSDLESYNYVKNYVKKTNIEYSTEDSCSLSLFKIAFGEFEDNINNIIKVVSAGVLKQFDNEKYNSYLPFVLGFINSEYNHNFYNFYTDFIINICEGEGDEELNEIVSGIIDNGSLLIQDYKTTIKYNLDNIKNNIWKVNTYNKAYVIFSNLPIDLKDFSELNDCNIIINIYKENKDYWGIELFKVDHTDDYNTELEKLNTRIDELTELINNPETFTKELSKELADKLYRKRELQFLLAFNCGKYLEKYYKGIGTENHGYVKISDKIFTKLLDSKTL